MIETKKPLKRKDQILIDEEISQRLQEELQAELEEEKRSKLFVDLMDKRKKHIAKLRAEEMLFDNNMKWVDLFVPMDSEVVEGSKSQEKGSKKRTREELESNNLKKQKIDDNVKAEADDEAEMKKHMEIVPDDEVSIDAIPLTTKSPIIIDWKIIKEGKMGYFQIIRVDGSSKHRNTRPEETYERVLWGDLKVMFEPDVESKVWRNLQGYNVTVWRLFYSSGVHFMILESAYLYAGREKGRIVGIKRLLDDLGVNTAKVRVTAAKHNLV
ncbi:hypothetical protein Tco_1498757, partial [Tanacetum coccineum]